EPTPTLPTPADTRGGHPMPRLFVYDGREFPDPDPRLSVEDVRKHLAEFFPELANADTREEKRGDDTVYIFARRIGTKGTNGRRPRAAVAVRRRGPAKSRRVRDGAPGLRADGGEPDVAGGAARRPEINLAVAEARAYARATQGATAALRRLLAR